MKKIRTQYHLATDFLLREISIYFWMVVAIFLLMTIFTSYLFGQNPELTQTLLNSLAEKFQGLMENGEISLIKLFLNNLQASAMGVLLGIVPFLFLPIIGVISNSAILGLVIAFTPESVVPAWKLIVFGILPHGIFELTAVFLCYAMGFTICWTITKRIIGRGLQNQIKDLLLNCLRAFLLIVIPLLAIAAVIETYVTSMLLNQFL